MSETPVLEWDAIRAAADFLAQRLPASPLIGVANWHSAGGAPILIKAESLMPTGSFKIRGATLRIAALDAAARARGVVAYSTGNHAQAVAKAAADAGVGATIIMSPDVPAAKIDATRAWGAEVVMAEPSSQARRMLAESLAASKGATLVPPYDDLTVMTGQASIGVELLAQLGASVPAAVYVPIGGGGLLAGVAAALRRVSPSTRIIGVEPELEDDARQSFLSGKLVSAAGPSASIADAIKVQCLGNLTFPLIQRHVDQIVTVSEAEIAQATLRYADEAHLIVEPGGAVALAAALRSAHAGSAPVIALACGGNVTPERLAGLRGMH